MLELQVFRDGQPRKAAQYCDVYIRLKLIFFDLIVLLGIYFDGVKTAWR